MQNAQSGMEMFRF